MHSSESISVRARSDWEIATVRAEFDWDQGICLWEQAIDRAVEAGHADPFSATNPLLQEVDTLSMAWEFGKEQRLAELDGALCEHD